ncbi:MAG: ubiquinol-cytochrome c reductase iron-sulfur subunit N-terminal domain-containing protein [Rhodovibrionaceae bacterium]|nr:ubiquinol-cytochrome c reductase iron-sulfur subunit N-terminal domain-containing protein [Rhodovibrionaceae bacterium]
MKKEPKSVDRRDFFRKASFGAGAAGVAAVALRNEAKAAETVDSPKGDGYRETDHVKKFYKLARF